MKRLGSTQRKKEDEATISAMLYNVAAMRAGNIRMADAVGVSMPAERQRAIMEANSALHFDSALGTASFTMLVPLVRGQLLTIERDFVEAEKVLRSIDRAALETRSIPLLLVDLAWCRVAQGAVDEGVALSKEAEPLISKSTHVDEVAYMTARVAQIAEAAGDLARAAKLKSVATESMQKHYAIQADLLDRLRGLLTRLEEKQK